MIAPQQLDALDPQQMRQALLTLMAEVAAKDDQLMDQAAELLPVIEAFLEAVKGGFPQFTAKALFAGKAP